MFSGAVLNAQSLSDSLLLYYPFNGNANDASGNGYHGTVYGATLTTDRFGHPNSAYELHGTDDYIDLPNDAHLKPPLPFSVSLWVNFNDINNYYSIFTTDYYEPQYTGCWINIAPNVNTGDTVISLNYGDGGGVGLADARRTKTGTTSIHKNQWYFIIAIFRGPLDMDIYVNCINDNGYYSGTGSSLVYTNNAGSIGRHLGSMSMPASGYYMNGKVDDVKFWNRALTEKDIEELCNPCGTSIDVSIDGLNSPYYTSDTCVALTGTPAGGNFYGTGVYNGTFCPNVLEAGTYNLVYVYNDIYGCSGATCQTVEIIDSSASLINENENENGISIYPNPTNTALTIELEPKNTESTLTICNINGQELNRQYIKKCKTQIDISNLASGVYFVKLSGDKIFKIKKFIKE